MTPSATSSSLILDKLRELDEKFRLADTPKASHRSPKMPLTPPSTPKKRSVASKGTLSPSKPPTSNMTRWSVEERQLIVSGYCPDFLLTIIILDPRISIRQRTSFKHSRH
jgi:hypothetical protein